MARRIFLLIAFLSLPAVAFAERPPNTDPELNLRHGMLSVRPPSKWEIVEQSGGEKVALVAFRDGTMTISLRSYLLTYLPDRNASPFYQELTTARYGKAIKSQFKSDSAQKWEVFTSNISEGGRAMILVDYYATVRNPHSHACGIHVRLVFPRDSALDARAVIGEEVRRFLSSVFIDSKI